MLVSGAVGIQPGEQVAVVAACGVCRVGGGCFVGDYGEARLKVTKWIDMGADVTVDIGADDIRNALAEAFARTNQEPEEAVNVHDILSAFNCIGSFLRAFTDEQIAALNDKQRGIIGTFLAEAAGRFKQ